MSRNLLKSATIKTSRALRANIHTTKSQTGNILSLASAGFESTEESVKLSDAPRRLIGNCLWEMYVRSNRENYFLLHELS